MSFHSNEPEIQASHLTLIFRPRILPPLLHLTSVTSSGLMGGSCPSGQYWDFLLNRCMSCRMVCKQPRVIPRCTSYCESAQCKEQPGHYYDGLLKKCMKCAEVCGGHPAECYQHCQTPPPLVTTKKLLVQVTSHVLNSREVSVPTALENSTVLLYSLLALCLLLLFSSLSLALAVLVRKARDKTSNPGPKDAKHNQEMVVQQGQEVGQRGNREFLTDSTHTTDREPSYDSSPTETCVCVHCFPDLKALGQGSDRTQRGPLSLYQHAGLHRVHIQKGGPVWTEENLHTTEPNVQVEATVE